LLLAGEEKSWRSVVVWDNFEKLNNDARQNMLGSAKPIILPERSAHITIAAFISPYFDRRDLLPCNTPTMKHSRIV
jgi:hypothetical protein